MRRSLAILIGVLALAAPASADPGDGGPFRRTTPRADVVHAGDWTLLGIPGGRAWGLESGLRPLDGPVELRVELAAVDPSVREAFLRVAFYARGDARSRQLAIDDSPLVTVAAGPAGTAVALRLDPPPGAVAYRLRLLGRLVGPDLRTAAGAIRARWGDDPPPPRGRPSLTRLLIEPP